MSSLKAKAYAKVNLFLEVTGKREDGYHLLDTVMQSVSLYDEVSVTLTKDNDVVVLCDNQSLSGKDNIVYKACEEFFKYSGWQSGLLINIKKNIPIAAGTGGGSADAATVLNILNKLSGKNYTDEVLSGIALKLGADVPFCIKGGTARALGIGEELLPLKTPKLYLAMLKHGIKKSTKEMYQKIDEAENSQILTSDNIIKAINENNFNEVYKNIYNAFEVCWDFDTFIEIFNGYPYKAIFLSGSGPTVCALFDNEQDAKTTVEDLKHRGFEANFASLIDKGFEIE